VQVTVSYCRVSTQGQEDNQSLATQDAANRQHAQANNWPVHESIFEIYSGANLHERPKLNQLRERVRNGEVARIICYSLDRLTREIPHLMILLDELDRYACQLVFVTEPLDRSLEGQLIQMIKGYAAARERAAILERTQRGKLAKLKSGKVAGCGRPLFGYRLNSEGQREIYEPEARIIRFIFTLSGEQRLSTRAICKELTEQGITTSQGRAYWASNTVSEMLRRTEYKGVYLARTYTSKKESNGKGKLIERRRARAPEDAIDLSHTTPAIVSTELWEAAQATLAGRALDQTRNQKQFYLLRGLVFCERCQRRLYTTTGEKRQGIARRYYYCRSKNSFDPDRCKLLVSAERLEREVWQAVAAIFTSKETIERVRAGLPDWEQYQQDRANILRARLAKLEQSRERLLKLYQTTPEESLLGSIQKQLQAEAVARRECLAELAETEREKTDHARQTVAELFEYFQRNDPFLVDWPLHYQRSAMEHLEVAVWVWPDKTWTGNMLPFPITEGSPRCALQPYQAIDSANHLHSLSTQAG
jgi:site-specific DNA recombinase